MKRKADAVKLGVGIVFLLIMMFAVEYLRESATPGSELNRYESEVVLIESEFEKIDQDDFDAVINFLVKYKDTEYGRECIVEMLHAAANELAMEAPFKLNRYTEVRSITYKEYPDLRLVYKYYLKVSQNRNIAQLKREMKSSSLNNYRTNSELELYRRLVIRMEHNYYSPDGSFLFDFVVP